MRKFNFTFNIDVKLTAPCHSISIIRPAPPNVLRSHRQSNKTPQRAHNSHILNETNLKPNKKKMQRAAPSTKKKWQQTFCVPQKKIK